MESSLKLGRVWGIPIGLHQSWFLIFGLVTWSLAMGYFPMEYDGLPVLAYWLLGAVTSLLFFGSVLLHELGHSITAIRNSIPVRSITLFIFGGVAQISREPTTPGIEFRIAIAGPLTSLGLAALFTVLWQLERPIPYLAAPSQWLARINFILAVFNMIPGFPLDGGRVLRAIVWKITRSFHRATQVASYAGQLVAFGFIGFGIFTVLRGQFFNGLWLVFIGWFLQNAAAASYAQVNLRELLHGVKVGQVMAPEFPKVSGRESLAQLVEEQILTGGRRYFFVTEDGQLHGMLSLKDITAVPRERWGQVSVDEVMVPKERLVKVSPMMELLEALQVMDDAGIAQVPVLAGDRLLGTLSREQILHYIRTRGDIGV